MSKALPTADAVAKLIATLVGRKVTAMPGPTLRQLPKGGVTGVCVDEAQAVVSLILADVATAAAAGAALVMIPASAALDASRSGILPPNIAENFQEVLNVMTSLLTSGGDRIVRLSEFAIGAVPSQASALMKKPGKRLDLEIEVQGYGKGALAILMV